MRKWIAATALTTFGVLLLIAVVFRSLTLRHIDQSSQTLGVETQASSNDYGKFTESVYDLLEKTKKPIDVEQQVAEERVQDALARVKILEIAIQDLRGQLKYVQQFNSGSTTQTIETSPKTPIFIPLGVGGTTNNNDWQTLPTPEIEINPADYPSYKSIYLVVDLKSTGNTAEVRLINHTDNSPLTSSLISTTSTDFNSLTSSGFTLPATTKKYRLQIRNVGGSETTILFSKLKITF